MSDSYLERIALALIKEAGFPMPIREYKFHPTRKWRCDFVWMKSQELDKIKYNGVMLEVEGGIWMKDGGHSSGTGITRDIEKGNEAALRGFLVIRATKLHLINGQAIEWLKRALGLLPAPEDHTLPLFPESAL